MILKILITYHSHTGNTEKVAKSMKEGFEEEGHDVTLMPAKSVDPSSLSSYDLVLLGSGIYASNIGKDITNLMKKTLNFAPKFAFFNTHTSPTAYQKAFSKISETIKQKNSIVLGEFDCIGENIGISKEQQLMMASRLPPEQQQQQKEYLEQIKGRPNKKDLENAKQFAKSLLK
jgi:flavodoxin